MNVDKLIAAIPNKKEADRRTMRTNTERLLSTGTAQQQAAARAVLAALDEHEAALVQQEREARAVEEERLRGLPRARRVEEAFQKVRPNDTEEKVIRALLDNPGSTSTALTAACAWRAQSWHMHFGKMCARRQSYLWSAKPAGKRDALFYCGILADYDQVTSGWTMKPDVAEAFEAIGIRARRPA